jgi:hypothetical protein
MPRLPPEHISEFVRLAMPPSASDSELRDAQSHWDDYLDVIDEIHARITRELRSRDSSNDHDILQSQHSQA